MQVLFRRWRLIVVALALLVLEDVSGDRAAMRWMVHTMMIAYALELARRVVAAWTAKGNGGQKERSAP